VPLTEDQLRGLDLLLNESVLVDLQLDEPRRRLALTCYVEMIPDTGQRDPAELYLQLVLERVSRLAACFRYASSWDDAAAAVEPLDPAGLRQVVRSIRYHDPLFGWRFIDVPEAEGFAKWRDRLSIDLFGEGEETESHSMTIWTEDLVLGRDSSRRPLLDLRVCFTEMTIRDRHGHRLELDAVIAASRRYWAQLASRGSGGPSPYPVPHVSVDLPGD
jgi:hypothetical protein